MNSRRHRAIVPDVHAAVIEDVGGLVESTRSAMETGHFLRAQQLYLPEIVDCFLERFAEPIAIADDSVLGRGLSHFWFEDVHVIRDTPSFPLLVEDRDALPIPGEFL